MLQVAISPDYLPGTHWCFELVCSALKLASKALFRVVIMRCPCLEYFYPNHNRPVERSVSPKDRSCNHRRSSSSSSSESLSVSVSKIRRGRIAGYTSHFFSTAQFDDKPLPFAHHLASITSDEVINFIRLPITIQPKIFPKAKMTKAVTIHTPTEFFRSMGYRKVRTLGSGGYGKVTLVEKVLPAVPKHKPKRLTMACKTIIFSLDMHTERYIKELVSELYVLKSLRGKCPFVIKYFEHYVLRYHALKQVMFVANIFMEVADSGTLWDELFAGSKPMPLELTHRYFAEIVEGLEFMHRHGIAHNDFKPNNVLLTKDNKGKKHCKLSDFGMSRFGWKRDAGLVLAERGFGTRAFMAPEALRCRLRFPKDNERRLKKKILPNDDLWIIKYDTFKSDIWSLGVTLYMMLTQDYPYEVPENDNIRDYIAPLRLLEKGLFTKKWLKDQLDVDDDRLIQLIVGMMETNPEKRFTIQVVAKSAWVKRYSK